MDTGKRAHAIVSEFSHDYVMAVREQDGGVSVWISSSAFGKEVFDSIRDAIGRKEQEENQGGNGGSGGTTGNSEDGD